MNFNPEKLKQNLQGSDVKTYIIKTKDQDYFAAALDHMQECFECVDIKMYMFNIPMDGVNLYTTIVEYVAVIRFVNTILPWMPGVTFKLMYKPMGQAILLEGINLKDGTYLLYRYSTIKIDPFLPFEYFENDSISIHKNQKPDIDYKANIYNQKGLLFI